MISCQYQQNNEKTPSWQSILAWRSFTLQNQPFSFHDTVSDHYQPLLWDFLLLAHLVPIRRTSLCMQPFSWQTKQCLHDNQTRRFPNFYRHFRHLPFHTVDHIKIMERTRRNYLKIVHDRLLEYKNHEHYSHFQLPYFRFRL